MHTHSQLYTPTCLSLPLRRPINNLASDPENTRSYRPSQPLYNQSGESRECS